MKTCGSFEKLRGLPYLERKVLDHNLEQAYLGFQFGSQIGLVWNGFKMQSFWAAFSFEKLKINVQMV